MRVIVELASVVAVRNARLSFNSCHVVTQRNKALWA
jgi:hypothetical protein